MKKIVIIFSLFVAIFIGYIILSENYAKKSETNYTSSLKMEIETLIESKKEMTFILAQNLASNPNIIKIMQNRNYNEFYEKGFLTLDKEFGNFKNISIHIVNEEGKQTYLSWTHKSLGEDILHVRADLRKIFKTKKASMSISVGKFDMTFKGIVPIFDKNHKFLGVIETITHFNSIAKDLEKQGIDSIVLIDKRFKKQLKYPFHNLFIQNYNVSNLNAKKEFLDYIKQKGVNYFINIKTYKYLPKKGNPMDGYYVVTVPVKGINNKTIGYYIAFSYDKFELAKKELWLNVIATSMALIILVLLYFVYKEQKENDNLIKKLNSEVKNQVEKNLELIQKDNLTGAYKRAKFEIDRKNNFKYVVMLNIKNFSKINSTYGFEIGDKVLQIVTKRIENLLKRKIYRINADEFVFLSNDITNDILTIKNSFIFDEIIIDKIRVRLSFSFGVVENKGNEILRKVAIALKESKKEAFKNYEIYQERNIQKDEFIKFNELLYKALFLQDDVKITPYFQGIRNNKTGEIIKYESLARLEDGDKVYSPFFFIDIAKNSGFIFEITKIMIDKSFKKLSQMDENVSISINITEDDLFSNTLKQTLLDKLEEYNIKPQRIILEVLEGVSASGTKENVRQLQELEDIGFKVSIDDFGVEYSNFERLSELDVDFIKIDGKYIKSIHTNKKSYQIAKAIAKFAHSMEIQVIAEFVENEEIQKIVEELEIDYSQGYYFSKPTRISEV
jgi:diguanylate cyclase (GGDEF)-like protein